MSSTSSAITQNNHKQLHEHRQQQTAGVKNEMVAEQCPTCTHVTATCKCSGEQSQEIERLLPMPRFISDIVQVQLLSAWYVAADGQVHSQPANENQSSLPTAHAIHHETTQPRHPRVMPLKDYATHLATTNPATNHHAEGLHAYLDSSPQKVLRGDSAGWALIRSSSAAD